MKRSVLIPINPEPQPEKKIDDPITDEEICFLIEHWLKSKGVDKKNFTQASARAYRIAFRNRLEAEDILPEVFL